MSRIAIIGAGPIGLEAALLARQLGHDVQVFEKGSVAENVRDWGHLRLFTPFGMNASAWGRAAVAAVHPNDFVPQDEALLTGHEFADRYLLPLSRVPELAGCIREQCQVISIGRRHFSKGAGIGMPQRAAEPFQLLVEKHQDQERIELADAVLDCSGTYPHHNWIGDGGLPCLSERIWLSESNYRLPQITASDYAGRRTLVIGSGFSAATTVCAIAALAEQHRLTQVLWITKSRQDSADGPIARIAGDSLTERDRIAETANQLARRGAVCPSFLVHLRSQPVVWLENVGVKSVQQAIPGSGFEDIQVELDWSQSDQPVEISSRLKRVTVDRLVANVGYRPDRSIYEELQVHECYATQGPMKLAAKLLGEASPDCLDQSSHGCDVLKNPEPNFFIVGSKSYGRNSNFLLRVGLEQVREVLTHLSSKAPA